MRFHVLSIPHTITNKNYNGCAFTQKVLKFGKMMTKLGHTVIHYGNEDSELICSEHVTVTSKKDLEISYGDLEEKNKIINYNLNDHAYQIFTKNAIQEIDKRKKRYDFILAFFGIGHEKICNYFDRRWYIPVEPGVGYTKTFAPCKVYESYALYHSMSGSPENNSLGMNWYDAVIPNYFDPDDFTFQPHKQDYYLYIGRLVKSKGIDIAIDVTKETGKKLIIAGQKTEEIDIKSFPKHVEYVGYADLNTRRELMANAKAGFVPSRYLEPFGGVQIEFLFSGTPTITTDWGAFSENNIHGHTGYRCRNYEQFKWATENINNINPYDCRKWAENYTLEKIGKMYEEYFDMVLNFYQYQSWYKSNTHRKNFDWLTKNYFG